MVASQAEVAISDKSRGLWAVLWYSGHKQALGQELAQYTVIRVKIVTTSSDKKPRQL